MLDEQLHNLQTDHIDYYGFHALTVDAWNRLKGIGALDFIEKARKQRSSASSPGPS